MLHRNNPAPRHNCSVHREENGAEADVRLLLAELAGSGCGTALAQDLEAKNLCGETVLVDTKQLLSDPTAFDTVRQHIARCVRHSTALTLCIGNLGAESAAVDNLEKLCAKLAEAGIGRSHLLGTTASADEISARPYALVTRCWLGDGSRYMTVRKDAFAAGTRHEEFWQYLWRYHRSQWRVLPAYSDSVSSACALLNDEHAGGVLPAYGVQVPISTAWLPLQIHIPKFANQNGVLHGVRLEAAIEASVNCGERLIELLPWPCKTMRNDVAMNRRLAIVVTGLGELVSRQNRNPSEVAVQRSMAALVAHIRATLQKTSAKIAERTSILPALAKSGPAIAAQTGHCDHWAARWQSALQRNAIRHRNLLVLSPYSVLPPGRGNHAAFGDLLPIIRYADAFGFAGAPTFEGWKFNDFKHFHRRAWSLIHNRSGGALVAARV